MARPTDEIRFALGMRPVADGRFEVVLRLHRTNLLGSETPVAVLKEGKAKLILRMVDQQLTRSGYREIPHAPQFDAKVA